MPKGGSFACYNTRALRRTRNVLAALGLGLVAMLAVATLGRPEFDLEPDGPGFGRLVMGATPNGTVRERAVIVLPGLERERERAVRVRVEGARSIGVALDRGELAFMRTAPDGTLAVTLEPTGSRGARLDLIPSAAEGLFRLESIRAEPGPRPWARAIAAGFLTTLLVFGVSEARKPAVGRALGLFSAGGLALAGTPASTFLDFPSVSAFSKLTPVVFLLGLGVVLGLRHRVERRYFGRACLLVAAGVFGLFIRGAFLASSGSWDTEIWKAWMLRSASHGLTRAYGDPGAVPEGHFWTQVRGEEDPWKIPHAGRLFVIDYPPLAILLWHSSWHVVTHAAPELAYGEAQNAAVKLPAVVGDFLALFVLLWALRDSPERGVTIAALYWSLPIAWYSSAVLGFFDGAFAPVALAALVAASRGRAFLAGLLMSVAFWIKPLAVIVAPALLVALVVPRSMRASGRAVGRALAPAGLVSAAVCLLYWMNDTADTMFVHLVRLFAAGNLSSGYPNPWWILGHLVSAARGDSSITGPVDTVTLSSVDFPVAIIGTGLVALTTAAACFLQFRSRSPHAIYLSAATAYFAYSFFGMGVFENHPHFVFLLLLATGVPTLRLALVFAITASVYVVNLFFLTGLGRFYGFRYWILEGLSSWHTLARMSLGFDATLALALINAVACGLWLFWLPKELDTMESKPVR